MALSNKHASIIPRKSRRTSIVPSKAPSKVPSSLQKRWQHGSAGTPGKQNKLPLKSLAADNCSLKAASREENFSRKLKDTIARLLRQLPGGEPGICDRFASGEVLVSPP
jgi:hypothetical protein